MLVDIYVVCGYVAGDNSYPLISFTTKEEALRHIKIFEKDHKNGNFTIQKIALKKDDK